MTRAEMQAQIVADYGEILEEKTIDTHYGNWYRVVCKVVKNEVAYNQTVHYIVYDEGGGGEEAYYKDSMPVIEVDPSVTTTAWRDQVEANIATKEAAGTIEKGVIREINEEKEQAVVEVYIMDTGILYNRLYFVYNDSTSTLQFEQIVQE